MVLLRADLTTDYLSNICNYKFSAGKAKQCCGKLRRYEDDEQKMEFHLPFFRIM